MLKNIVTQGFKPLGGGRNALLARLSAFTLAEVLITLGIIGVVAAMTIPTLVADYQERSYNTAATTFERKLGEALKVMNSQMTLAGHSSTESFVDELKKHIKITKTCANDKLMDCFENEVFWGDNAEAVDMTVVKKAKNFGQKDWQESNVIGVQFANGVSALIAYNKDAKQDPYSNEIVNISGGSDGKKGSVSLGTTALAILYDTNGSKSPNKSAKDLRGINVSKLGKGCFLELDGLCIGAPFSPSALSNADCQSLKDELGIVTCHKYSDYWAGAVKECGKRSKVISEDDLNKLANYLYDVDYITGQHGENYDGKALIMNPTKAALLGFSTNSNNVIWSNFAPQPGKGLTRTFGSDYTRTDYTESGYFAYKTFCILD